MKLLWMLWLIPNDLGDPSKKKTTFLVTNVKPPLTPPPSCDKKPPYFFSSNKHFLRSSKMGLGGGLEVWDPPQPFTSPPHKNLWDMRRIQRTQKKSKWSFFVSTLYFHWTLFYFYIRSTNYLLGIHKIWLSIINLCCKLHQSSIKTDWISIFLQNC